MIDRLFALPLGQQARVLWVSRGSVHAVPRPPTATYLRRCAGSTSCTLAKDINSPFAGSRMLLAREKIKVGRRHISTLVKKIGIEALYRRPDTSKPEPGHKITPICCATSW